MKQTPQKAPSLRATQERSNPSGDHHVAITQFPLRRQANPPHGVINKGG